MFADSYCSSGPLTSRADKLLGAAQAHIASRKDTFRAGLKVDASHQEALLIGFGDIFKRLAIGGQADEDENGGWVQLFSYPALSILYHHRRQTVLLSLEFDHLGIEADLDLGRVHRFIDSDLAG